jgi:transposase InsO family protein
MKSITEKARYKHAVLTRIGKMRRKGDKHAVKRTANYFEIGDIKKIYKWQAKWDGSWQSLVDMSHRPKSHPHAHSKAEIELMIETRREVGFIAPLLFFQELCERGYSRTLGGMKRFMRKHFGVSAVPAQAENKPKLYEGGKYPGEKLQIDVKYVPSECNKSDRKLYQFTAIDECTRWCYREIWDEKSTYTAQQFLLKLVEISPFPIRLIQTDNGAEFTNALLVVKKPELSLFEEALVNMGIEYKRIRIATPRHNGRVERQHGLDGERFYNKNKFYSLADARTKLAVYNDWSNSRIKTCLNLKSPNQVVDDYLSIMF